MSLDEALDQLVREAQADPPPGVTAAARLQQALDELAREARRWAAQNERLQRRLARRRAAPDASRSAHRQPLAAADLNTALDELARHAVAARGPAAWGPQP